MLKISRVFPMYESILRNKSLSQLEIPEPKMAALMNFVDSKNADIAMNPIPAPRFDMLCPLSSYIPYYRKLKKEKESKTSSPSILHSATLFRHFPLPSEGIVDGGKSDGMFHFIVHGDEHWIIRLLKRDGKKHLLISLDRLQLIDERPFCAVF